MALYFSPRLLKELTGSDEVDALGGADVKASISLKTGIVNAQGAVDAAKLLAVRGFRRLVRRQLRRAGCRIVRAKKAKVGDVVSIKVGYFAYGVVKTMLVRSRSTHWFFTGQGITRNGNIDLAVIGSVDNYARWLGVEEEARINNGASWFPSSPEQLGWIMESVGALPAGATDSELEVTGDEEWRPPGAQFERALSLIAALHHNSHRQDRRLKIDVHQHQFERGRMLASVSDVRRDECGSNTGLLLRPLLITNSGR